MSGFLNWYLEDCAARLMRVIEFTDEVALAISTEGGAASPLEALDVVGGDWQGRNLGGPFSNGSRRPVRTLERLVLLFYNIERSALLLIYWFGCTKLLAK
jgi:hypothetical protein